MLSTPVSDLVADILREIRVLSAVDVVDPNDQVFVLRKVNRLIDRWNAKREAVYLSAISRFTFTPALSPHTIGPAGTFVVTQRPEALDDAHWITTGGISIPIAVRDAGWWANQTLKTLQQAFPSDVYYEPAWPAGKLYFWPIPTTAYNVDLQLRLALAQIALGDTLTLPPGYAEAITLTAAQECVGPFNVDMPADLPDRAREARAIVFAANGDDTPYVSDAPGGDSGAFWDYHSRRTLTR